MTQIYPPIEPYDQGMLDVGDGNHIAWEVCGNPDGRPAVLLHGGPGSGRSTSARRFFDPDAYKIILFDQRGCGASTPHASEPGADLSVNTTAHLLRDMECLRDHLDVDRWLIFGHSWGCTLGLAYAQRHRERVHALVLVGVATCRASEIDWLSHGLATLFPEQWDRFCEGAGASRGDDLVALYCELLNDADPAVCAKAAKDWHDWEAATFSVDPDIIPPPAWSDPRFRLARARIVAHYFRHKAWLEEGEIMRDAHRLAGLPGVMVQGRLDLEAPLTTAWELSRVWPDGELVIIENAGHSHADAGVSDAIVAATDRFA